MILNSIKTPALDRLVKELVRKSADQAKVMLRRFDSLSEAEAGFLEDVALKIIAIAGENLRTVFDDYLWLCGVMLDEEIYFRRHGSYRYRTFQEAFDNVYSDETYMSRYLNGLLLSQLFWSNHSEIISFYRKNYLGSLKNGSSHLEIGPGHGLLLAYACDCPQIIEAAAWDISSISIQHTNLALKNMGVIKEPRLEVADFFSKTSYQFDSIVFSEVLEHTEDPRAALSAVASNLAPSGMLFLNMPINSPAPDHLFNLPSPEDLIKFVRDSGLVVRESCFAPITNSTLERARRLNLTISCGVIATKAE